MNKVEPQVISPWATGPNKENTPWPQKFKEGGELTKREKRALKKANKGKIKRANAILDKNTKGMDKYKKGGSQNVPTGFGY